MHPRNKATSQVLSHSGYSGNAQVRTIDYCKCVNQPKEREDSPIYTTPASRCISSVCLSAEEVAYIVRFSKSADADSESPSVHSTSSTTWDCFSLESASMGFVMTRVRRTYLRFKLVFNLAQRIEASKLKFYRLRRCEPQFGNEGN
jgi:hypothetical protein